MPFTIEVYNKENGICVDRITAYSVRAEGIGIKLTQFVKKDIAGLLSIV